MATWLPRSAAVSARAETSSGSATRRRPRGGCGVGRGPRPASQRRGGGPISPAGAVDDSGRPAQLPAAKHSPFRSEDGYPGRNHARGALPAAPAVARAWQPAVSSLSHPLPADAAVPVAGAPPGRQPWECRRPRAAPRAGPRTSACCPVPVDGNSRRWRSSSEKAHYIVQPVTWWGEATALLHLCSRWWRDDRPWCPAWGTKAEQRKDPRGGRRQGQWP